MLAMLNGWEVVAILAVVLIVFGAKKLPELARGLGQGIKEFKKSSREIQEEITQAIDRRLNHRPAACQIEQLLGPRSPAQRPKARARSSGHDDGVQHRGQESAVRGPVGEK